MPLPTQYSEATFANYLASVPGELAPILGWDAGSVQVLEAVNDALLEFPTTDITTVTASADLRGLRALGRRAIWRAVVQDVAAKYDFRDSDATFSRSQMQAMAKAALEVAEHDCAETVGLGLSVGRMTLDFLEPASEWR